MTYFEGFPRLLSGKEFHLPMQEMQETWLPWVRNIPQRRKWQTIPLFLFRKSQGQRSLMGYSPGTCQESDVTWRLSTMNYFTCSLATSASNKFPKLFSGFMTINLCKASEFCFNIYHYHIAVISSLCTFLLLLFSCSAVSESLWPHGLQHSRLPCPSPFSGAFSNTCPLSWWCHPTILSSVVPFSSFPQGLFKWVSSSHQVAKVLEFQLQHQSFQWTFRTDLLKDGLDGSPCSPRDSQESSRKSSNLKCSAFFMVQLSHLHMTTGKTIALAIWTFVCKVMSLLQQLPKFIQYKFKPFFVIIILRAVFFLIY